MLRWIGACIIILACGMAGVIMARSYTLRPKYLQDLVTAVQLLATEINYTRTSLPDACLSISNQLTGPVAQFFNVFATQLLERNLTATEAWSQALQVLVDAGFLKQDVENLSQFGNVLGRSDAEDQLKHIALLQNRLESTSRQAEQERDKMVRLWNYLGFCVGALVVLMLI